MEPLPKTINDLVTEIREDLDEAVNPSTNLWDDTYLVARMNRGFREIWQAARETKENWFTRKLVSTDAPLRIHGRMYDPVNLRLTETMSEVVLPLDCYEILSFTAVLAVDGSESGISIEFGRLGSADFRELRGQIGTSLGRYVGEVVYREGGPHLVFAPTMGVSPSVDMLLEYVYQPKEYVVGDSLENSGFNRTMLDAAAAYGVLAAREKEDRSTDAIQRAERQYGRKLALVTRSAGPRQTQDDEVVEGYMESEI